MRRLKKLNAALLIVLCSSFANAAEDGIPLHAFADFVGGNSTDNTPTEQALKGMSMGNIDFYLTPEFQGRFKSLIEFAYEPSADNGAIGLDVERLQVGYTFNNFTLWMGRFHTPFGQWNTAYHHGAQLQNTIYRPRFIDFEDKGGIIPAHSVGAWGHGTEKIEGVGKLSYDVYLTNGARIVGYDPTATPATDGHLDYNLIKSDHSGMGGGNVAFTMTNTLPGLQVGLHTLTGFVRNYASDSYASAAARANVKVLMTGGYLAYESDTFQFLSEFYNFMNKDVTDETNAIEHRSWAYFAQASYAIDKIVPYAMYEKTSFDFGDPYFYSQGNAKSYERQTLGIRYDFDPQACLKLQHMQTNQTVPEEISYKTWVAQVAVRF